MENGLYHDQFLGTNGIFSGLDDVLAQDSGGKGDNANSHAGKRASARGPYHPTVKPLGLPPLKRQPTKIEEIVEAAEQIHQDVSRETIGEIEGALGALAAPELKPIALMSMEEIHAEIALRMRENLEQDNQLRMLLLLVAASV